MIENNIKLKLSKGKFDESLMPWSTKTNLDFLELGEIFSV